MKAKKIKLVQNIGSTDPEKFAEWLRAHFNASIEKKDRQGVWIRIGDPCESYRICRVKVNSPDVGVLEIWMKSTRRRWVRRNFERLTRYGAYRLLHQVYEQGVCIGYVQFFF